MKKGWKWINEGMKKIKEKKCVYVVLVFDTSRAWLNSRWPTIYAS